MIRFVLYYEVSITEAVLHAQVILQIANHSGLQSQAPKFRNLFSIFSWHSDFSTKLKFFRWPGLNHWNVTHYKWTDKLLKSVEADSSDPKTDI